MDGKFRVGDLAAGLGEQLRVAVTVSGPEWVSADSVELFANGIKIREQKIESRDPQNVQERSHHEGTKARVSWTIPRPKHDLHLVAIASGPGVRAPYWAIAHPYQPSSRVWKPRVIGATNPVWVDADGDGQFTAARVYAQTLARRHGLDPVKLLPALASFDEAVAAQTASLLHKGGVDLHRPEFKRELRLAPNVVQRGFSAFLSALPKP